MPHYSEVMSEAACVGLDPELFFDPSRYAQARLICAGCPAIAACLEMNDDLAAHEGRDFGVWGGMSPGGRAATRRYRYRTVTYPTTGRAPSQAKFVR